MMEEWALSTPLLIKTKPKDLGINQSKQMVPLEDNPAAHSNLTRSNWSGEKSLKTHEMYIH